MHWGSHAPGNLSQELQAPVTADRGHVSRDGQPKEDAACSIQAALSQHLETLWSEVMLMSALVLSPRVPETPTSCWPEVKGGGQ